MSYHKDTSVCMEAVRLVQTWQRRNSERVYPCVLQDGSSVKLSPGDHPLQLVLVMVCSFSQLVQMTSLALCGDGGVPCHCTPDCVP